MTNWEDALQALKDGLALKVFLTKNANGKGPVKVHAHLGFKVAATVLCDQEKPVTGGDIAQAVRNLAEQLTEGSST